MWGTLVLRFSEALYLCVLLSGIVNKLSLYVLLL